MALPFLSVPAFPDVPRVAGVPALLRKVQPILDAVGYIDHVTNAVGQILNTPALETWGVFKTQGEAALEPDSFIGIEYKQGSKLLDYPVEDGGFATYNKVQGPFDACITMAKGGSMDDRQKFIKTVAALCADLELYTITTPDASYLSVNLERYDYRQEQQSGSHIMIVTLYFREIRVIADSTTHSPEDVETAAAADPEAQGQVSPVPPTPLQDAATNYVNQSINDVLGSFKRVAALPGMIADRLQNAPPGLSDAQYQQYKTLAGN
jgi:hypothetical protein